MEEFHKKVWDLQHRFNDCLDDRNDPLARQMSAGLQRLEDDAQTQKNARTLEDEVKALLHLAEEAKHSKFMSMPDLDNFHHRFEDLRHDLQKLM